MSTSTPPGSSPTDDQANPQGPPVCTWQAPRLELLPVNETDWPLAKHHRVLMFGSSSKMTVGPCVALKTMLGLSQHHHHHGKISRMAGFDSLAEISAVRPLSGCKAMPGRAAANPTPVIRSAAFGCRSGATLENSTGPPGPFRSRCSRFSITARMSSSHHHGQHCHQIGAHGHQQKRQEHQLKVAVKLPLESVGTVARGVFTKPPTPLWTL